MKYNGGQGKKYTEFAGDTPSRGGLPSINHLYKASSTVQPNESVLPWFLTVTVSRYQ